MEWFKIISECMGHYSGSETSMSQSVLRWSVKLNYMPNGHAKLPYTENCDDSDDSSSCCEPFVFLIDCSHFFIYIYNQSLFLRKGIYCFVIASFPNCLLKVLLQEILRHSTANVLLTGCLQIFHCFISVEKNKKQKRISIQNYIYILKKQKQKKNKVSFVSNCFSPGSWKCHLTFSV